MKKSNGNIQETSMQLPSHSSM